MHSSWPGLAALGQRLHCASQTCNQDGSWGGSRQGALQNTHPNAPLPPLARGGLGVLWGTHRSSEDSAGQVAEAEPAVIELKGETGKAAKVALKNMILKGSSSCWKCSSTPTTAAGSSGPWRSTLHPEQSLWLNRTKQSTNCHWV